MSDTTFRRTTLATMLVLVLALGWVLGARATNTLTAYREQQARVDYLWAAFGPAIMQRIQQERAKQQAQAGPQPEGQPAPQSSEPPKEEKK